MSSSISSRLNNYNISYKNIYVNFTDKSIFNTNNYNNNSNNILIYNGNIKSDKNIYGEHIYLNIINKLKDNYNFILSSDINLNYEEMPKLYNNIFIALRLTQEDGNANTVHELIQMNKPIIHNGDEIKSIKWKTEEDIIKNIIYYDKIRFLKVEKFMENINNYINFYNKLELGDDEKEIIKENIDLIDEHINIFDNILLISSDYPNYGGCATNTYNLYKYYKNKLNKNVKVIFFCYKNEKLKDKIKNEYIEDINIKFCYKDEIIQKSLEFNLNFDLIIIRNNIDVNLKIQYNKSQIFYLIAGIFKNDLQDYYYNVDLSNNINKNVIKNIILSDKIFCNSSHTLDLLQKFIYNKKIYLYYFNFINYYDLLINKENKENKENKKKYNYGVIISDYMRKIKNIDGIIKELEKVENKKIIFIGKNIKKIDLSPLIKNNNIIKTKELISNNKVINYMKKTEYIIIKSFYESCSNVMVDSFFNSKIINNI